VKASASSSVKVQAPKSECLADRDLSAHESPPPRVPRTHSFRASRSEHRQTGRLDVEGCTSSRSPCVNRSVRVLAHRPPIAGTGTAEQTAVLMTGEVRKRWRKESPRSHRRERSALATPRGRTAPRTGAPRSACRRDNAGEEDVGRESRWLSGGSARRCRTIDDDACVASYLNEVKRPIHGSPGAAGSGEVREMADQSRRTRRRRDANSQLCDAEPTHAPGTPRYAPSESIAENPGVERYVIISGDLARRRSAPRARSPRRPYILIIKIYTPARPSAGRGH
jgi:hypothetical protein